MPSLSRQRGKHLEKAIAKTLDGHRVGVTGLATCDVEAGPWAIECKSRKTMPALLRDAMAQAVRNAGRRVPCVVLHEIGQKHANDLVILRLEDFTAWFGSLAKLHGEIEEGRE